MEEASEAEDNARLPLERLRRILTLQAFPGWSGAAVGIAAEIAGVVGVYEFYRPAIQAAGGAAMAVLNALLTPLVPLMLIVVSCAYLGLIATTKEDTARAIWLPLVGWFGLILLFGILAAWFAFVGMIVTSRIPDLISYVNQQTAERHIAPDFYKSAYKDLRKDKADIANVHVTSVRSSEAVQYAIEIIKLLNDAGIRTLDSGQRQIIPETQDAQSTARYNMVLFAKGGFLEQNAERLLRDDLIKAGAHVVLGQDLEQSEQYPLILRVDYP